MLTSKQKDKALKEGMEMAKRDAERERIRMSWNEAVKRLPDAEKLLPRIAAYILDNPETAASEDGFERAYHAVRSADYRSEEELLEDEAFIERMAKDERIRRAVITDYLAHIAGNTENDI